MTVCWPLTSLSRASSSALSFFSFSSLDFFRPWFSTWIFLISSCRTSTAASFSLRASSASFLALAKSAASRSFSALLACRCASISARALAVEAEVGRDAQGDAEDHEKDQGDNQPLLGIAFLSSRHGGDLASVRGRGRKGPKVQTLGNSRTRPVRRARPPAPRPGHSVLKC